MRAAIFAGAIAGSVGCGDAKPAVEDPTHKIGPSDVSESDAMAASPDEEVERHPGDIDGPVGDDPPPMPYGAPPARKRIV